LGWKFVALSIGTTRNTVENEMRILMVVMTMDGWMDGQADTQIGWWEKWWQCCEVTEEGFAAPFPFSEASQRK
jgi:hypothetical protein